MHAIIRLAIMRKDAMDIPASLAPQPFHIGAQRLAYSLAIIQNPDLFADKLHDPDGPRVCPRAGPANVAANLIATRSRSDGDTGRAHSFASLERRSP